jgi:hypothetical protein
LIIQCFSDISHDKALKLLTDAHIELIDASWSLQHFYHIRVGLEEIDNLIALPWIHFITTPGEEWHMR